MKMQGRENVDYSYQLPEDGWHNVEVLEGIDFYKVDGEAKVSEKGNKSVVIEFRIDGGEENDKRFRQFYTHNTDFGELKICDLILHAGLQDAFNKQFPGDVSIWDPKVFQGVQLKLPKKFLQVKTVKRKDGKGLDVVSVLRFGAALPDGGNKSASTASTASTAKAAPKSAPAEQTEW